MFVLGNAMFACGVRSTQKRSLEEDRSETDGEMEESGDILILKLYCKMEC